MKRKIYDADQHYYSATMPSHDDHVHLNNLLENNDADTDYKILQAKQRIKKTRSYRTNEMTSIDKHRLTATGQTLNR